MQKTLWVGDRPGGTWVFQILDQKTGNPVDLGTFTKATVVVLDPRNKPVDIPDSYSDITNSTAGEVSFLWPQDSIFTVPGRYVMQVRLDGNSVTRLTTVQEILVRKLGGVIN